MSPKPTSNIAASVHQRLLNLAKPRGEELQSLLTRHALERLLYRLSQSRHRADLVLKGAFLFVAWKGNVSRPTKDLDFLAFGHPEIERFERMFKELCDQESVADGLIFDAGTVRGEPIREASLYDGIRIELVASLGNARIPLQVDIGFGDAIEPPPTEISYPTLLDFPAPVIKGYRRELVIAEKFEAMVARGSVTSRLKDYYDIWLLSENFDFDARKLSAALTATFARRSTALPEDVPSCLDQNFTSNPDRIRQWDNLVRRFNPDGPTPSLAAVAAAIGAFLMPTVKQTDTGSRQLETWPPGGPWKYQPAGDE